ncbi:MAG: hypothetical protein O7C75_18695 [Verrucomicrobia bacterium]|nr:hypothetical protein [Verrucomicrobiota bacterium]
MLRIIRPGGKIGDVAKWEGILYDPIGALIAVLVFEALLLGKIELHILALSLEKNDFPQAQQFFTEIIFVVLGTVLVYGSLATVISQKIGISNLDPQGVLFVGAPSWARRMAKELHSFDVPVFLIDSNEHRPESEPAGGLGKCIFANKKFSVFNSKSPPMPKRGDRVTYIYYSPHLTIPPFPLSENSENIEDN